MNRPGPALMPNGAVGRAGTLASALPLWALFWDRLIFLPAKWESHARIRRPKCRGHFPHLPASPGSLPQSSAPPGDGRKQLGALWFQAAVASLIGCGRALRLGAQDPLSARAGPPPGTAGDPSARRSPPAGQPRPRLPPTSLQQPINIPWVRAGGNGLSSAPSGPGPSPPGANCARRSLDASQPVSAWEA